MNLYFCMLFAIAFVFGLVFQATAQDFFPEIGGWKKSDPVQIYKPVTLYEYINGAAELYLNYNFQELQVAEYQHEKKASLIVEVYRYQTANDAFGIYSQERSKNGQFLDIGAQGYLELPILNFYINNFYVKISSYYLTENAAEILKFYAEKLASSLGGESSLPAILQCFPDSGKIQHSEKYIARSFLGHGFLHSGFIVDYVVDKEKFQLFIIEAADSSESREMLAQYFQLCQIFPAQIKQGHHVISDPYHGEIALAWKCKYIWGVKHLNQANLRNHYLQEISCLIARQMNTIRP